MIAIFGRVADGISVANVLILLFIPLPNPMYWSLYSRGVGLLLFEFDG